ncbi:MAG: hypothetical protein R3C39_05590 [Dehalococcoidia bacterium]
MSRYRRIDDDWVESTEGDLDPDLAEEQPYSSWEPRQRPDFLGIAWRVVAVLIIASLVLGLIAPLI